MTIAILVSSAVALSGCAQLESLGKRVHDLVSHSSAPKSVASDSDGTDYGIGDCIDFDDVNNPDPDITKPLPRVDCKLSHDFEVDAVVKLIDLGYPGGQKLAAVGTQECRERFTEFAGGGLRFSTLDTSYLAPGTPQWDRGDHDLECVVFHADGSPSVGTLRNFDAKSIAPSASPPPAPELLTSKTYKDLAAGDCFDGTDLSSVGPDELAALQPCSSPHVAEIFATPTLGFDTYPSDAAVDNRLNDVCFDTFTDYVGVDYDDSYLAIGYSWPAETDWAGAGTRGVCMAMRFAFGPDLEGSIRGVAH